MSLAALEREMESLPAAKRKVVEGSILGIGEAVVARAAELSPVPVEWRSALVKGVTQLVVALLKQDPEQLERLSDVLRKKQAVPHDAQDEQADLEAQNLLRVLAMTRRVEQQSLAAKQLPVSRQRLNQLRGEGKILGIKLPMHREYVYPPWQFGRAGRLLPIIPRLLDAAREGGLDGLDLHLFVTSNRIKGERPLIDHLRTGNDEDERYVLEAVRAAGNGEG